MDQFLGHRIDVVKIAVAIHSAIPIGFHAIIELKAGRTLAELGTLVWTEAVGADLGILVEKPADGFNRNLNYIGISQAVLGLVYVRPHRAPAAGRLPGRSIPHADHIDWAEEDCKGCADAPRKGVAGCRYRSGFAEANPGHNR